MRNRASQRLVWVLLVVAAWGLTISVNRTALMSGVELRLLDARFEARRVLGVQVPIDPSIVLVLIDDEARAADPDPPQLWVDRFARMSAALVKAGARVVGVDFILLKAPALETLDRPTRDALVTISDVNRAALVTGRGGVVFITGLDLDERGRVRLSLPSDELRAVVGDESLALANLTRDVDGRSRAQHVVPLSLADGADGSRHEWEFFASLLAQRALGVKLWDVEGAHVQMRDGSGQARDLPPRVQPLPQDLPVLSESDKRLLVNFAGFEVFPRVSWAEVVRLSGSLEQLRARFADKIVLIGLGSRQDQDIVATPLTGPPIAPAQMGAPIDRSLVAGSTQRDMLGVEVHAHVLNTMLTRNWLRRAPTWVNDLLMLFLCFTAGLAVVALRPVAAALATLSLVIAWFGVTLAAFAGGWWIDAAGVLPAVVSAAAFTGLERFLVVRRLFGRYVSDAVATELLADQRREALGATGRQEVTVLFSDINGFSTVCETAPPDRIIAMLNAYFRSMVAIVERHQGWLKQFVGDEIMAVYGVPRALPDAPRAALETALDMLDALGAAGAAGLPGFYEVKIGIHTGEVIVGNVGTESRAERAVVGDDVNLGARIMALAPRLGASLLISEATHARVANMAGVQFVDRGEHDVKGRAGRIRVYEVHRA